MARLVEDLETAAGNGRLGHPAVAERDDGVVAAPYDESWDAFGEVGAVQHRDDLAAPVDAGTERAQDGPARLGVGKRVEDGKDLLRVASQRSVEDAQDPRTEPADGAHRRQTEQRHHRFHARDRRQPEQRADRSPYSPAPHQNQTLAALGKLVRELRGDAATQRMPDDSDSVHVEH